MTERERGAGQPGCPVCGTEEKKADSTRIVQATGGEGAGPVCCKGRHKDRTPEEVRCLTNRLSRIEGQIRGIRGMVEEGAYCPDILNQSSAVTAAMNAFNRELLSSHIRTCVAEDIRAGEDATIDELVRLLQKLMK